MTFKVTTIDYMYTNNIVAGINTLKYEASKFKTILCKLGDNINIGKFKKIAVIAYEKHNKEWYLILNYYRRI